MPIAPSRCKLIWDPIEGVVGHLSGNTTSGCHHGGCKNLQSTFDGSLVGLSMGYISLSNEQTKIQIVS